MGEVLSTPIREKELDDNENQNLRYGSCGMQGWRRRMEDAHITDISKGENSRFEIFGVFDGHGGKEVSSFAKLHFTDTFLSNPNIKEDKIKQAIIDTFLKMDELMREPKGKDELKQLASQSKKDDENQDKKYGNANPQIELFKALLINKEDVALNTGCTACVCIIDNKTKKIYFANAGDSRAVMCKKGVAYPMSIDHKPDLELEKNRIIKAEGWISNGRINGNLNLSRGFGDLEYKSNTKLSPKEQIITAYPDVIEEDMSKDNEFIIIGCDGIWDCLQNQNACDLIRKEINATGVDPLKVKLSGVLSQIVENICPKEFPMGSGVGCDNMTCLVIQFK